MMIDFFFFFFLFFRGFFFWYRSLPHTHLFSSFLFSVYGTSTGSLNLFIILLVNNYFRTLQRRTKINSLMHIKTYIYILSSLHLPISLSLYPPRSPFRKIFSSNKDGNTRIVFKRQLRYDSFRSYSDPFQAIAYHHAGDLYAAHFQLR